MARRDKFEAIHARNRIKYEKEIKAIFREVCRECGMSVNQLEYIVKNAGENADFARIPAVRKVLDKLQRKLAERLEKTVVDGVKAEWSLANDKYDALVGTMAAGDLLERMSEAQRARTFARNMEALEAFLQRKEEGLGLSQRVWQYSGQMRDAMEVALELGISEGQSAAEIARELQQYLVYPDKLFRRVRDKETGELKLSKPASLFHPGQGVYRSSYKNALRLALNETNIAYRKADSIRRQGLSFVVGIEVHLSNNHNCKGIPEGEFFDICDLLQGKYPPDFEFVGWHPNCRCWTSTIMQTDEEFFRDSDGVYRGSVNEVKDVPPQFRKWLEENRGRIERAEERGTLPYFLRDNTKYWENELITTVSNDKNTLSGDNIEDDAAVEEKVAELLKEYRAIKSKRVDIPHDKLYLDITGGLAQIAKKGFAALANAYYSAESNKEKIAILKTIVDMKEFQPIRYISTKDNTLFAFGIDKYEKLLKSGKEIPSNLQIAQKFLNQGYDVFVLSNPRSTTSADFIIRKAEKLFYVEGKTSSGGSALSTRLSEGALQSERIAINLTGEIDYRTIGAEIKEAFTDNQSLIEIIIFKRARMITVSRENVSAKRFLRDFRVIWNQNK